jgi:hypothetical protein
LLIDSSPPHGFSPYGHGTFVPVQTTYKPSAVFWIFEWGGEIGGRLAVKRGSDALELDGVGVV